MRYIVLSWIILLSLASYGQETDTVYFDDALVDTTVYETNEYQDYDSENYSSDETNESEAETPKTLVAPRTLTEEYKSEPVQVKDFNKEKWKKIAGDKSFIEDPEEEEKSKPESFGFD